MTDALRKLIESGEQYDEVITIGPADHDEIRLQADEGIRRKDRGQHEPHHD